MIGKYRQQICRECGGLGYRVDIGRTFQEAIKSGEYALLLLLCQRLQDLINAPGVQTEEINALNKMIEAEGRKLKGAKDILDRCEKMVDNGKEKY